MTTNLFYQLLKYRCWYIKNASEQLVQQLQGGQKDQQKQQKAIVWKQYALLSARNKLNPQRCYKMYCMICECGK